MNSATEGLSLEKVGQLGAGSLSIVFDFLGYIYKLVGFYKNK